MADTSDRWARINELFAQALDIPEPQRASWLEQACGDDSALRVEVESLLAYDLQTEAGLLRAVEEAAGTVQEDEHDETGLRAGAYELTREIGRGGMGAVYLGVRTGDQFRQQAAVKLVRRGMNSQFILSRFRHERRILAALNHPHIARLLDGGSTADGRPYFVMEYVDGRPLLDYCEANSLDVPARLKLFLSVCDAVEHAHQHMV